MHPRISLLVLWSAQHNINRRVMRRESNMQFVVRGALNIGHVGRHQFVVVIDRGAKTDRETTMRERDLRSGHADRHRVSVTWHGPDETAIGAGMKIQ